MSDPIYTEREHVDKLVVTLGDCQRELRKRGLDNLGNPLRDADSNQPPSPQAEVVAPHIHDGRDSL